MVKHLGLLSHGSAKQQGLDLLLNNREVEGRIDIFHAFKRPMRQAVCPL